MKADARTLSVLSLLGSVLIVGWFISEGNKANFLLGTTDSGDSVRSALHHLSSTSLVQRAAADCAADSKCIPTVDELVNRAAAACASDPGCVCDWAKYPKKCFLSEVARHKQLTHDAKELVSALRAREEAKALQIEKIKAHNSKFESLLEQGHEDLQELKFGSAKNDLIQAEVQHRLSERYSDGHLDLHIPLDQTKELEAFAREIVRKEREHKAEKNQVSAPVQNALSSLSSQIQLLMKKVANRGGRGRDRNQEDHDTPDSTAAQIRELTEAVAKLTGKVNDLQHGIRLRLKRGRTQQLSDDETFSSSSGHEGPVEHDRYIAEQHQRIALANALRRGRSAIDRGDPAKAKTALLEVEYYRRALSRLQGRTEPCPACDSLKQETGALSSELSAPATTTQLADEPAGHKRSATSLERAFDKYLSAGDRALVQGRIKAARAALHRAKGRFAELEAMRLPGADGVIKHEMRDALRALTSNIASRADAPSVDPVKDSAVTSPASAPERSTRRQHDSIAGSDDAVVTRRRHHALRTGPVPISRASVTARRGRAAASGGDDREHGHGRVAKEKETPGASRLLRRLLARPGYYTPQTLRVATEGLKTATLRADGELQALDPSALRRIRRHFDTS